MATKVSVQEAGNIFTAALPANGGAVEYNSIVEQLQAAGNGAAVPQLNNLVNAGIVQLSVIAGENGPVLHIARGGNSQ